MFFSEVLPNGEDTLYPLEPQQQLNQGHHQPATECLNQEIVKSATECLNKEIINLQSND